MYIERGTNTHGRYCARKLTIMMKLLSVAQLFLYTHIAIVNSIPASIGHHTAGLPMHHIMLSVPAGMNSRPE